MFDSKLANSIQRDYRQAADTHRLTKPSNSTRSRRTPVQATVWMGLLIVVLLVLF